MGSLLTVSQILQASAGMPLSSQATTSYGFPSVPLDYIRATPSFASKFLSMSLSHLTTPKASEVNSSFIFFFPIKTFSNFPGFYPPLIITILTGGDAHSNT